MWIDLENHNFQSLPWKAWCLALAFGIWPLMVTVNAKCTLLQSCITSNVEFCYITFFYQLWRKIECFLCETKVPFPALPNSCLNLGHIPEGPTTPWQIPLQRAWKVICLVLLIQPSGDIEHALSWLISLSDYNASTIFSEVCWLNIQCWLNIRQKKSPLTNICIAIPQWGLIEGSGHLCHHHHPDWIRNKNISVYLIKRNILARRQFLEQKSFISITKEKCVDPLAARLTEPVTTMRQDCFGKIYPLKKYFHQNLTMGWQKCESVTSHLKWIAKFRKISMLKIRK